MLSCSTLLRFTGFFLLANSAYSKYQLNHLSFIILENNHESLNHLNNSINTLPLDLIIEIFIGCLLILLSVLFSLFTPSNKSSSSICNDSITVSLKNGNWIINSISNYQHPLRFIDLSRANNEIEKSGKGCYAYLDNRANFINLTKRAINFQNWFSSISKNSDKTE